MERRFRHRDYPRVCGGTDVQRAAAQVSEGLSPRVRGNPVLLLLGCYVWRTIPACAGEPWGHFYTHGRLGDYPRVCGGTNIAGANEMSSAGLSPRVRGNPFRCSALFSLFRTIPACAGEPTASASGSTRTGDYPRVCGGTILGGRVAHSASGLSPRVRGNPGFSQPNYPSKRTIPACAGEPWARLSGMLAPRDYPRVCGGTPNTARWGASLLGLSPRVRGEPPCRVRW